jgi:hypothetical protein
MKPFCGEMWKKKEGNLSSFSSQTKGGLSCIAVGWAQTNEMFNHQRSLNLEMCVSRLSLELTAKVPKHQTQIHNLPPLWH